MRCCARAAKRCSGCGLLTRRGFSRRFDTDLPSFRAQRSALTYITIIVIASSIVFFCFVFLAEVYQTVCKDRIERKANDKADKDANSVMKRMSRMVGVTDTAEGRERKKRALQRTLSVKGGRRGSMTAARASTFGGMLANPDGDLDDGDEDNSNTMRLELNPMMRAQAEAGRTDRTDDISVLSEQVKELRRQQALDNYGGGSAQAYTPHRPAPRGPARREFGPISVGGQVARRPTAVESKGEPSAAAGASADPTAAVGAAGGSAASAAASAASPRSASVSKRAKVSRMTPEERRAAAKERMKQKAARLAKKRADASGGGV